MKQREAKLLSLKYCSIAKYSIFKIPHFSVYENSKSIFHWTNMEGADAEN